MGLQYCASRGYSFNGFVFLLFLGFLASGLSIALLTKMKKNESQS